MEIKSNTIGKLEKIRKGTVFTESFTFAKEFIQNCQRSKAKNLSITIDDEKISFIDDGCGCKDPSNLLTLDYSSWESTTEGFGIGFWSCIAIPDLTKINIRSKNWNAVVDVDEVFQHSNLNVEMNDNLSNINGFCVTLESPYFNEHFYELKDYICTNAKYIENMRINVNGEPVETSNIFEEFKPYEYHKTYENRIFKAKISISCSRNCLEAYYDKRKVDNIYEFDYVQGVLEFKTDKITLKEPDRTSFVRDEKYRAYRNKLKECIHSLYKDYISEYGIENEDFTDGIATYLRPKEYEKYLELDICDSVVEKKSSTCGETVTENDDEEPKTAKQNVLNAISRGINVTSHQQQDQIISSTIRSLPNKKQQASLKKKSISQMMPQLRKCVWVESHETDYYKDMLADAEYCGIKIIKAKNRLYRYAFQERGILHISSLKDCLVKTTKKTDICLKSTKEEAFIQLLNPICEKYNLPYDTFKIANLATETVFSVNGNTYYRNVRKNKKGNIQTYGVTDGYNIYLDRHGLNLSAFAIKKDNYGIHEVKAVMHYINTIAHEMAHLLYKTTDNTVEHYEAQEKLLDELMELYLV